MTYPENLTFETHGPLVSEFPFFPFPGTVALTPVLFNVLAAYECVVTGFWRGTIFRSPSLF